MINFCRQAKPAFIIGLLFILTGILCNEWTLTSLLSDDNKISFFNRAIIWIFDFLLVITGVYFISKRKSLDMKRCGYNIVAILLVLVIVEAGLHFVQYVVNYGKQDALIDRRLSLPHFEGKGWAKDLFWELDEISGGYKPFRGWGKNEYHGKYLNIDANGARKTWNPDIDSREKQKTIYMLGASNIWGDGARDDHTVPSYISKQLYEKGYKFNVFNYGEWSYSFTQEVIYLTLLLRDGHKPDYVIISIGNDIYNAYQSGTAGTLHFAFLFREEGKKLTNIQHIFKGVSSILQENSLIYGELIKIKSKLKPQNEQFSEEGHKFNDDKLYELSRDIVEYIARSVMLLDNLSKVYDFKYMFFWPPSPFTEDELSDDEIRLDIRLSDDRLHRLYRFTYDQLRAKKFDHFYSFADIFTESTKSYYLDFGHTSEEGNEIIAGKIVEILEKEYIRNE